MLTDDNPFTGDDRLSIDGKAPRLSPWSPSVTDSKKILERQRKKERDRDRDGNGGWRMRGAGSSQ